jgi:hypothetical protein
MTDDSRSLFYFPLHDSRFLSIHLFTIYDSRFTSRTSDLVSFTEAATVFFDPLSITVPDPLHSEPENRFVITILAGLS